MILFSIAWGVNSKESKRYRAEQAKKRDTDRLRDFGSQGGYDDEGSGD